MDSNSVSIRGEQIRQLLTKFYYKDSHLHYQILLEFANGKTVLIKEFTNYTSYKKVFSELQRIRKENLSIRVPQRLLSVARATN
ncbi:MAG: hypothetical protein AB8G22_23035 [Saprospiraceae bacterium]